MKTLYVTDLDGTLLDRDAQLSEVSKRALQLLYDRKVMVAAVTGRSWSALDVLKGAKFRAPYVLLGGARIYDVQEKKLLREHTYVLEDAKFILDAIKAEGLSPFLYTQNEEDEQRIYYEVCADENAKAYVAKERAAGDHRFYEVSSFAEKMHEKLFIITVRGEEALLTGLRDQFLSRGLHAYLYHGVHMSGVCFLEASVVSKRVGVEDLRALTGAQRVVAFGDNGNDEGMFAASDVRIAMENATDALKAKADCVIGNHTEDAVVRTILEMEGIRQAF